VPETRLEKRQHIVVVAGEYGGTKGLLTREDRVETLLGIKLLNERTSRYSLIAHVPFKTAQAVSDTMIALLRPFASCVHTLTTDNGKEFAQHERIASALDADFFFAHPYASWERGANENMNGLIRQFFPKKMRFDSITPKHIAFVMHRLNHRPRKCLGFKTPHEIFMKQLQSHQQAVALRD
jgi:IS30 family transposase